ncbi:MAG: hypothetical protein FJX15_15540, partial [Alphaproteobacteria bacterium]|nr:hypothetical protein [Alphaproteobacteria bacterium]
MSNQTTRRAVMAGIAAAPVAGLPAIAAEADPIFAVIERAKAADARHAAACALTDAVAAQKEGRIITPLDRAEFDAAEQDHDDAHDAFLTTPPTTVAGVRAYLRHCIDDEWTQDFIGKALQTLLYSPVLTNDSGAGIVPTTADVLDPFLSTLKEFESLERAYNRAATKLEEAESEAAERLGQDRPLELITWRNFFIGGSEIETRRQALLLEQGNDPEKIEAEYIDAKRRERDAIRAGQQWDKLAGIAELRFSASDQLKRLTDLIGSLASTKPTTAQGAAAAARFLNRDLRDEVPQSHRRILNRIRRRGTDETLGGQALASRPQAGFSRVSRRRR